LISVIFLLGHIHSYKGGVNANLTRDRVLTRIK